MKYGRYRAACAVMAMSMAFAGCGEKSLLDAKNPVTIEIWNYYNGDQLTAFDSLVEEFNATVGKEEGIIVCGYGIYRRRTGRHRGFERISDG